MEARLAPIVSFAPQVTFASGLPSIYTPAVTQADLNGDGRPDLILIGGNSNIPQGGRVSVLLNTTPAGSTTPSFAAPQTFAVGNGPYGLAVADLTDSGKPDLIVTNDLDNTVAVLINTSGAGSNTISFQAQQTFAVGLGPTSVSVADFNSDGRPDLVVANEPGHTMSVLLNTTTTGNLSFAAQQTFALGGAFISVATADFNGDHKSDVVLANPFNKSVAVLLNTTPALATTAAFAAAQTFATGETPLRVAVPDINEDGRPDFVVSNEDGSVSLFVNLTLSGATTASFLAQQTFAVGAVSEDVAAADFNGDGRPDLAVTNYQGNSVSVLENTNAVGVGSASFVAQQTCAVGTNPDVAVAADFNGDGLPDLAVVNTATSTVSVLFNTTPPTADSQVVLDAPGQAATITLTGHVPNNDPRKFTVTANPAHGTLSGFNAATGAVTYTPDTSYLGADGFRFTITDTRTGFISAAATVSISTPPPPVRFAPRQTFTVGSEPAAVAVADFNGDGKPDLAVADNVQSGTVSVLLNTTPAGASTPSFAAQQTFAVDRFPTDVVVADFNGDGKPDLAVIDATNTVSVLLNTTPAGATVPTFAAPQTFAVGIGALRLLVSDFNGDGRPDLAVSNNTDNTVSVLLNTTAAGATTVSFAAQQTFDAGLRPYALAAADFNGDGKPDLAVTSEGGTVAVLVNTTAAGSTTAAFAGLLAFGAGYSPDAVSAADFNGDGRPDLAVVNGGDRTVSVFWNTTPAGSASVAFAVGQTYAVGTSPGGLAVGDFNGDGRGDLALDNLSDAAVAVLPNVTPAGSGPPFFAVQQTFPSSSDAVSVAVADFNGDGRPDLVLTDSVNTATTVSVLLNTTVFPPTANSQSLSVGQGLSRAVTLTGSAPNGDPITFQVASGPSHGALSGTAPNLTYTPESGFTGDDTFTFTVTDTTTSLVSNPATVSVAVIPVPTANAQSVTAAADTSRNITLTGTAPNGHPFTFSVTANPGHGTLSGFDGSTGAVTYTPAAGYTGSDSFQFTVTDTATNLTSAAATVSITVATPPTANPQSPSAAAGHPVVITLSGSAPAGHAITFALSSSSAHGTITSFNSSTGRLTYTSNPSYAGPDSFTFKVTDIVTGLSSVPATVSLTVTPSPVVVAQFGATGVWQVNPSSGTWTQLTPATAALLATDRVGDAVADFPGYGVWLYKASTGWKQIHPVDMSLLAMNASGVVAAQFPGYGVGEYTPGSGWRLLTGASAALLAIDAQGDIAGEFRGYGVWEIKPGNGWVQIHPVDVSLLAMDSQGDIAADFPGYGVGEYRPGSGWVLLNGTQATTLAMDGSGNVVANFTGAGVGEFFAGGGARLLTPANTTLLGADAFGEVFASFAGYGVWEYDPTRGWVQVRTTDASLLAVA